MISFAATNNTPPKVYSPPPQKKKGVKPGSATMAALGAVCLAAVPGREALVGKSSETIARRGENITEVYNVPESSIYANAPGASDAQISAQQTISYLSPEINDTLKGRTTGLQDISTSSSIPAIENKQQSSVSPNMRAFLNAVAEIETNNRNVMGGDNNSMMGEWQIHPGTRRGVINQYGCDPGGAPTREQRLSCVSRWLHGEFPQAAAQIDQGNIQAAIPALNQNIWPSLPGGPQQNVNTPRFWDLVRQGTSSTPAAPPPPQTTYNPPPAPQPQPQPSLYCPPGYTLQNDNMCHLNQQSQPAPVHQNAAPAPIQNSGGRFCSNRMAELWGCQPGSTF